MKLFAASIFMLATGCAVSPTQGGIGEGVGTPHLDLRITYAPAVFDSVFVNISRGEIGTAGGGWVTLADQPQTFDLLTLQNDATALLGGADLAPGAYTQLRLIVNSASVVVGGVEQPLTVASGAQTGLKLNIDADITAGRTYTRVIDFDAGKR